MKKALIAIVIFFSASQYSAADHRGSEIASGEYDFAIVDLIAKTYSVEGKKEIGTLSTNCTLDSNELYLGYTDSTISYTYSYANAVAYCDDGNWGKKAGCIDVDLVNYFYIKFASCWTDINPNVSGMHLGNNHLWRSNSSCEALTTATSSSTSCYHSTSVSESSTDYCTEYSYMYSVDALCPSPPCDIYWSYTDRAYLHAYPPLDQGVADIGCFHIQFKTSCP